MPMPQSNLRIGLTMRITETTNYVEFRDSVAHDWHIYMDKLFPESKWMYIPNLGENVEEYVRKWKLNALILTGGDDLGDYPARDLTERILFRYALQHDMPVLGICRGLQVIYDSLGGTVERQSDSFSSIHVANEHQVTVANALYTVNSYHNNKLLPETIPKELTIIARCIEDGSIEGVRGKNILGLMWHPERHKPFADWDANIIHDLFCQND